MEEIWKDVLGYEGLYMVSNMGRVMSLHCLSKEAKLKGIQEKIILKNVMSSSGYYHVGLSKNGKKIMWSTHVLVASAFIPNPENKPSVNHIDGNRLNNTAENLEWATYKENQQHAIRTGLRDPHKPHTHKIPCKERSHKKRRSSAYKGVLQYDIDGHFIKLWETQKEAAESVGGLQSSICKCTTGKRKMCYGFIWKKYSGEEIKLKIAPINVIDVKKYSANQKPVNGHIRAFPTKREDLDRSER